ncbi:hypothetical protein FQA39_LY07405 [Lamprigera yunnana]|nr:hypothetical protein FQA39_LY07405 [Lamprigera yunnana]
MLKVFEEVRKNFKIKPKAYSIDNIAFKLHYRITTLFLLAATVLVTSRQYIGDHIKCISDKGVPDNIMNTYCFFTATFTVVKHLNATMLDQQVLAHPGVGPLGVNTDEPIKRHAYYQWVPFVLFGQALMFYGTHILWKKLEGERLRKLVDGMQYAAYALGEKELQVNKTKIPSKEKRNEKIKQIKTMFMGRLYINRSWSIYLMLCEFLNFVHVIIQFFITNAFLSGEFLSLGAEIIRNGLESSVDQLDIVFPKKGRFGRRLKNYSFEKINFRRSIEAVQTECLTKGYGNIKEILKRSSHYTQTISQNTPVSRDSRFHPSYTLRTSNDNKYEKSVKSNSSNFCKNRFDQNTKKRSYSEPTLNIHFNDATVEKESDDYNRLKRKLCSLETDHKKLTSVAAELTVALQTHILGQSENLNETLTKCKIIYPELFLSKNDNRGGLTVKSNASSSRFDKCTETNFQIFTETFDKSTGARSCQSCHKMPNSNLETMNGKNASANAYFDIDYKKLKNDMLNGNSQLKLAIVRSLRKRVIMSVNEIRRQVVTSYVQNDLLDLTSTSNIIQAYFLNYEKNGQPLQEEMSRFMNTLASLKLGRDYFCTNDYFLIFLLIPILKGGHSPKETIDEVSREMLIATVQKLSLKHKQRECMIDAGLTEYVTTFLSNEHSKISRYCLEYTTALFMNLCLHHNARRRLYPIVREVVELMRNLLNSQYNFCLPYVNGAIYSLLSDPFINEEALQTNFSKLLEYHIENTEGGLKMELEHILRIHLDGLSEEECERDSTIEPDFELDILEPELDDGDSSTFEDILTNYSLNTKSANFLEQNANSFNYKNSKTANSSEKTFLEMSYNEETKQMYYIPSSNNIFAPKTTFTSAFTKTIPGAIKSNKPVEIPVGNVYHPQTKEENLLPTTFTVSACYRNDFENFKSNYNGVCNSNKYSCNCYDVLNKEDAIIHSENKYLKISHNDPTYQNKHEHDESNIKYVKINTNNKVNKSEVANDNGTINFSLDELSKITKSDELHASRSQGTCQYDVVFQSRPKLPRTPP